MSSGIYLPKPATPPHFEFGQQWKKNRNKPNDKHHCCGRYIKCAADRSRHEEVYHRDRRAKSSHV